MSSSKYPTGQKLNSSRSYIHQILREDSGTDFADHVKLAATICGGSVAILAFIEDEHVWIKDAFGLPSSISELPGGSVFLNEIFKENTFIHIPLIEADPRFKSYPGYKLMGLTSMSGIKVINAEEDIPGYLIVFGGISPTENNITQDTLALISSNITFAIHLICKSHKIAEDDRLTAEHLMRMVFRNSIDAVVVTNNDGAVLLWNPKAEELLGWKGEKMFGENFSWNSLQGIVLGKQTKEPHNTTGTLPDKSVETTIYNSNKDRIDVALSISRVEIGTTEYYVYDISDISERKKTARALELQREFYQNILNNIPIDIAVFSKDHKYLYANPTAIKNPELRNYIIGKDDFEYARFRNRPSDVAELRRAKFNEAKNTRREIGWEDAIKSADGSSIAHLRRMFPVFDEHGDLTMMIGLGMDITERKQLEDKQNALLQQLSHQNVQLTDFCNIVSHNLRAPLVNIAMLSEFIENCTDADERKVLIDSLNNVLDNLNSAFNELVESIQTREDPDIKSEPLLISKYLQRIVESLEPEIISSCARIDVDIDRAPVLNYPPKYLNSILHNLISNALKYRSPDRSPEIKIASHQHGDKIYLSVADNGLGIDMAKHKNNFFKIGKVFHHHPDAKGFGLYMIKAHIEAMGGKIWVESTPDQGATFFIEFTNQKS